MTEGRHAWSEARPAANAPGRAAAILAVALLGASPPAVRPLVLPGGGGPIGFDDLRFSPELRRVLVPAGRTGRLDLVEPGTLRVESVPGFATTGRVGGHGDGTTSADAGAGLVFASDRTARTIAVVDPAARRIVARAPLGGAPDYVRWVEATREVWVTEPDREAIEVLRLAPGDPPRLVPAGTIAVPGGPESLVVDRVRGRAYTNTFRDATLAIAVQDRSLVARWANGCRGARGIALDPGRGLLFVGCEEGRAVALDAGHGGAVLGRADAGAGVDVIDFAPSTSRLYLPGADAGDLTVVQVGERGDLAVARRIPTARGAHCVAADDAGHAFVCDPERGRLLVVQDEPGPSPRSGRLPFTPRP